MSRLLVKIFFLKKGLETVKFSNLEIFLLPYLPKALERPLLSHLFSFILSSLPLVPQVSHLKKYFTKLISHHPTHLAPHEFNFVC